MVVYIDIRTRPSEAFPAVKQLGGELRTERRGRAGLPGGRPGGLGLVVGVVVRKHLVFRRTMNRMPANFENAETVPEFSQLGRA